MRVPFNKRIQLCVAVIALIWLTYGVQCLVPSLTEWGLIPRTRDGLVGILSMPFLHGSLGHLLSNTVPLAILSILLVSSRDDALRLMAVISISGAGLLWAIGRQHNHVGASGLIYGLIAFLLVSGFVEKRWFDIAISMVVLFLFGGSLIMGVLPTWNGQISWDGHLCGAIAGTVLAFLNKRPIETNSIAIGAALLWVLPSVPCCFAQEIVGIHVVPHQFSSNLQWRKPPEAELAARVELFLQNKQNEPLSLNLDQLRIDSLTSQQLIDANAWTWHDFQHPDSLELPPQSMVVLRFNGKNSNWGCESKHRISTAGSNNDQNFELKSPTVWIEGVSFLKSKSDAGDTNPRKMIASIRNASYEDIRLGAVRLWLPETNSKYRVLHPSEWHQPNETFPLDHRIRSSSMGLLHLEIDHFPLSYAAIEIQVTSARDELPKSIWAHLRIKPNDFDISGGWIASEIAGKNSLQVKEYVRVLKRLHINTGQIEEVSGFTDNAAAYSAFPVKRFNRMDALERYDSDSMLPHIHAVEFLGEPQYGGGRPVPPQEIYNSLAKYQPSRLPTSITLSEERTWRYYAGLSDYPHFDAYRVIAPAADDWSKYNRWDGKSIRWGAPLETIGDMTRSLREQSRPKPIAYWSQGAHHDWGGFLSPRRGSPTADELRSQAWQGLGNGIGSLYWFNLSISSLCKFPDLVQPIQRVNQEIVLLRPLLEEAVAFHYRRINEFQKPDLDLSSLVTSDTLLLVANDLQYKIDSKQNTFQFQERMVVLQSRLPDWFSQPMACFRIDADGTHAVSFEIHDNQITIQDRIHVVGIYVVSMNKSLQQDLQQRLQEIQSQEKAMDTETGSNLASDLETMQQMLKK